MTRFRLFGWLLILATVVPAAATPALASSHREAPAISQDPSVDNTDLWAWVEPGSHDVLYVVASYNPMEEPSGGPNFNKFADDALYEIHIVKGTSLDDAITYQFRFQTNAPATVDVSDPNAPLIGGHEFFSQLSGQMQTYSVTKIEGRKRGTVIASGLPVAPPNIGPRTADILYDPNGNGYTDAFAATFIETMGTPPGSEGQVWAGPRDDGFYVDLGGIFDLANVRGKGSAQDGVAGFNCHTIALEIPIVKIIGSNSPPHNGTPGDDTLIGVWASASRRKITILKNAARKGYQGPFVQVSRQGLPLINEAVIGIQDKDKYNRTTPKTDLANFGAYFLNPIIVRDAVAVGVLDPNTPDSVKFNRLDIVGLINLNDIPTAGAHHLPVASTADVLRLDVATDSSFPNGRPIPGGASPDQEPADVTDVLLSFLLTQQTSGVSDGVDYNDKDFLPGFPWLALPWEGFSEGHGKTTP